jgi:hypothetical protein
MPQASSFEEQHEQEEKAKLQRREDLRQLLTQPTFVRFLGDFFRMSRMRVFSGDLASCAYNAGRVDVANELLDALRDADLVLLQKAERENFKEAPSA